MRLYAAALLIAGLGLVGHSHDLQARELTVGISETDYTPFYFETEDGTFQGAATAIVRHLATKLNHTLTFRRFPWRRVQHNLATGKIDMVMIYFKTKDRAEHATYVDIPHIYESSSLVVTKNTDLSFDGDINGLNGYLFGNVSGYWHGAGYSENDTLKKAEFSSTRALLATLIRSHVDIAVGNKPVMLALARKMKIADTLRFLEPKIDFAPDYIAFSKAIDDSRALADTFSDELRAFVQTDGYHDILKKYGFTLPSG